MLFGNHLVTMKVHINPWEAMMLMDTMDDSKISHSAVHCFGCILSEVDSPQTIDFFCLYGPSNQGQGSLVLSPSFPNRPPYRAPWVRAKPSAG